MTKCPHCGVADEIYYNNYSVYIEYFMNWKGEHEDYNIKYYTKPPVYGKCSNCGKRIRLSEVGK